MIQVALDNDEAGRLKATGIVERLLYKGHR